MKKSHFILALVAFGSCVTMPLPPPALYVESLPHAVTAELTLDDRIKAEEIWTNIRTGSLSKAEKSLSRLGSGHPVYFVGQGYVHLLRNEFTPAEENFKTALITFPELALAQIGLVHVYRKTGRDDLAFNELLGVLKKDPNHPWARTEYEDIRKGKTEEALAEAEEALSSGDREKEKRAYLKALHYSPELSEAHFALVQIYRKEFLWSNALVHFRAIVARDPKNASILKMYADTLLQSGDLSQSHDIYEKVLELNPSDKQTRERVENLKNRLGIYDLPSQYEAIPAAEAITRESMAALLAVKFKGILEAETARPPIIIDIATSWASKFIIKTASLGLMDVYSNHGFQPKKIVTRGEMAETVFRTVKLLQKKGYRLLPQIPPEKIVIPDVSPEHAYFQPITQVVSYQLMDLTPDKTFRPDQSLKGTEAARILDILLALIK